MRILIDLDDSDLKALDRLAKQQKILRSALTRQAIDSFLDSHARIAESDAFGLWGNRVADGLAYEDNIRREW